MTHPDGQSLIGPNAVLQLAAAMERHIGRDRCRTVLLRAGLAALPDGSAMIAEAAVLRLHRALLAEEPANAAAIAAEAGARTADYIMANRIPRPVVWLLQLLPGWLAARLLMRAIARHAWTFAGAGRFVPTGAWQFVIDRSEAGDPERVPPTLFLWYGAVFAQLFDRLVAPGCTCCERAAGAGPDQPHHYRIERNRRMAAPPSDTLNRLQPRKGQVASPIPRP